MPGWETVHGPSKRKILSTKRILKIGTWNVRTLFQEGKDTFVAREMVRYGIDILGVTEARWDNAGEARMASGHKVYYSGHQSIQPVHTHGVAIILSKEAQKSLISWVPHGPRLMEAIFKTQESKIKMRIIVGYAPTNDALEENKDSFYNQLETVLDKNAKNNYLTLLLGDFNAKTGADNRGLETVMGTNGTGVMNENGEKFTDFCHAHNLVIGGSIFPHKEIHKYTWTSPNGTTKNQIDHICVTRKFRRSLLDVRAFRGADANSDHNLVIAKLQLKLKKIRQPTNTRDKFDIGRLKQPEVLQNFKIALRNRYQALTLERDEEESIDTSWNKLKNVYIDTSKEVLGRAKQQNKTWITAETLNIIDERRKIKDKILETPVGEHLNNLRDVYKELDKQARRSVRRDKRKYTENLAEEAEEAAQKNNMKDLYSITKKLSGNKSCNPAAHVKSKDGKLLVEENEVEARWVEHFSSVLNQPPPQQVANIPPAEHQLNINCDPPSRLEVMNAIKALKNNKAAGPDNIVGDILKADLDTSTDLLQPFISKVWETEEYPQDWKNSFISVLPKKGDLTDCNNHRGISLLSAPGKVQNKIILTRIRDAVDNKLRNNQAGFRRGRSCTDQIATMRIILEQCREFNSSLYVNFIDYTKAFDSIDRECLWKILAHYGIPEKLIRLIRKLYENSGGQVLIKGRLSIFFEILTGVKQGCLLSPFLFLLVIDWVMKKSTLAGNTGIQWNLTNQLEDLDFADDIGLLSHSHDQMQRKTTAVVKNSASVGLNLNISKTKLIKTDTRATQPINVNLEDIEEVDRFTYLGSVVAPGGGTAEDVRARISKARGSFAMLNKIWRTQKLRLKTKIKIFNSNVKSVLLYGSETWFLTTRLESNLQVFVNKCLKRILNVFWPNTISNEELWQKTNQKKITDQIKTRKFRWLGHTLRKQQDDITKQALRWNPQGQRRRGRPRLTWRRKLEKELKELNLNYASAERLAQDRRGWRALVAGLSSA